MIRTNAAKAWGWAIPFLACIAVLITAAWISSNHWSKDAWLDKTNLGEFGNRWPMRDAAMRRISEGMTLEQVKDSLGDPDTFQDDRALYLLRVKPDEAKRAGAPMSTHHHETWYLEIAFVHGKTALAKIDHVPAYDTYRQFLDENPH